MPNTRDLLLDYFDNNKEELLEEFFTFLRFESISSEAEFAPQVRECAGWVENYLKELGLQTELVSDYGHPIVFGQINNAGPDKPTVLIYAHYDVQPVDPLDLWETPPFEPQIRDGEVYARGAMDDKGQCYYSIAAVKALLSINKELPVNIKVIIEGEEEVGSAGIAKFARERAEQISADYLLVVDFGFLRPDTPAITLGVRGISTFTLTLTGSKSDLHSGVYGGIAYNPNHALVEMLSALRDSEGRITVPGFYDNIRPLTDVGRSEIDFDFDEANYEQTTGGKPNGGEKNCTPLESSWLRPSLEINGISGGYSGRGFKTVIPAKATAKISCRLVPDQDGEKISASLREFLEARVPEGMEFELSAEQAGPPHRTNADSAAVRLCAESFQEVCDSPCQYILCGGSVPITAALSKASGAEALMIGFGLPGDNMHAPNEHFGVDRVRKGLATMGLILEKLGGINS